MNKSFNHDERIFFFSGNWGRKSDHAQKKAKVCKVFFGPHRSSCRREEEEEDGWAKGRWSSDVVQQWSVLILVPLWYSWCRNTLVWRIVDRHFSCDSFCQPRNYFHVIQIYPYNPVSFHLLCFLSSSSCLNCAVCVYYLGDTAHKLTRPVVNINHGQKRRHESASFGQIPQRHWQAR